MFPSTLALLGIVLLGNSGCMSPQQARLRRIEKHRDIFQSFPEDIREKVMAGQVEIGFTPDMVKLALGRPNRIRTRLCRPVR